MDWRSVYRSSRIVTNRLILRILVLAAARTHRDIDDVSRPLLARLQPAIKQANEKKMRWIVAAATLVAFAGAAHAEGGDAVLGVQAFRVCMVCFVVGFGVLSL